MVVKAPFWVPDVFIQNFIKEKEDWIVRQLQKITAAKPSSKKFIEGEPHLFLGRELPLKIVTQKNPTRAMIEDRDTHFLASVYHGYDQDRQTNEIKNALLRFYLEQGIAIITEKANYFSELLGVRYSEIKLKEVSSIWGSCSASNNLSFNRKLIMAPHYIIDYVVIHEVCHMRERNHSSRFWALVCRLDPEYRHHRRWLRDNQHLLNI